MTCRGIFTCTLLLLDSKDKRDGTNAPKSAWRRRRLKGQRWTFQVVVTDVRLGSLKDGLGRRVSCVMTSSLDSSCGVSPYQFSSISTFQRTLCRWERASSSSLFPLPPWHCLSCDNITIGVPDPVCCVPLYVCLSSSPAFQCQHPSAKDTEPPGSYSSKPAPGWAAWRLHSWNLTQV